MKIHSYYTRQEAAVALGVSPQRVSAIARRDGWETTYVGRNALYDAEDVEQTITIAQAQKAWAILGIPRRHWGQWWLADPDSIDIIECPACGDVAYGPAGNTQWTGRAACPACGWQNRAE